MAVALDGRRPIRPPDPAKEQGLSDKLWNLMEHCWNTDPGVRPSAEQIVEQISNILPQKSGHRIKESAMVDMQPSDSFWNEESYTLTFPDNFATVAALLKRGQHWLVGTLWTMVENFEATPQECSIEKEYRTILSSESEGPNPRLAVSLREVVLKGVS